MAPSYSWHPGSPALNSCWTFNIPIHPDELLSSWLIRIALKHACSPLSLTGEIWPDFRSWTIDLDRNLPDKHLNTLSVFSGVPSKSISNVLLKNYASCITMNNSLPRGHWPWILSIGSRNRKHSSGIQVCPECLNTSDPYYKTQWRFAWHTICEVHKIPLIQRCPHCNTLINPVNLEYCDQVLSICYHCKRSLSSSKINHNIHPSMLNLALDFQQKADNVLLRKKVNYKSYKLSIQEWFQFYRFLINITRKLSIKQKINTSPNKAFNSTSTLTGLAIEMLSIQERLRLFSNTQKLLLMTFSDLMLILNQSVSPSVLHDPKISMPNFLKQHLQHPQVSTRQTYSSNTTPTSIPPPKSPKQVKQKWARLMRKYYLDYENMR